MRTAENLGSVINSPMEYLDLKQLTQRIPFSKSILEELISKGTLVEGVHFRRPTGPHGKRIFFWSAIEKWLKGQDFDLRVEHASKNEKRNTLPRLPFSGSKVQN